MMFYDVPLFFSRDLLSISAYLIDALFSKDPLLPAEAMVRNASHDEEMRFFSFFRMVA